MCPCVICVDTYIWMCMGSRGQSHLSSWGMASTSFEMASFIGLELNCMPGISPISPPRQWDSKCILAHNFNVIPGDLEIELIFMLSREALYWQILPTLPHISLLVFYSCCKFLTRQGSGYCPWISIQPHIWYSMQSVSLGILPEIWLAGKILCYCPSEISQC